MTYFQLLVEAFRFIKRYRERERERYEREASERSLDREHQRLLIEGALQKIVDLTREQNHGLVEIARASSAQSAAFTQWLDGFKISDPSPAMPISMDDVEREARENELRAMGFPVELAPEYQLAFTLKELDKMNQDALGDFDREGSDF